jgi:peptide-methionine (S)-S-oxide reductase
VKLVAFSVAACALVVSMVALNAADKKLMNTDSHSAAASGSSKTERITFGGGCFWCIEAVFARLDGVKSTVSGYAGGKTANPTYKEVCNGDTGHAEVVQIVFYPAKTSFEKMLEIFWAAHDPTTLNRQGADVGTQYRSAIFYETEAQKIAAEKSKKAAQKEFSSPIVTEIAPLTKFYPAEDYHQAYFELNGRQPYCQAVIAPKLRKLIEKGKIHERVVEPATK